MARRLRGPGICLRIPPLVVRVHSPLAIVAQGLSVLYAHHEVLDGQDVFVDFHISVHPGRRFPRAQCIFSVDGFEPFTPLALGEGYAFLEWGLNWCVSSFLHNWLSIHSAVLERDGRALLLPAPPGSGKSTLCAALLTSGWRLLSDEMALVSLDSGRIIPAPRPVSLKNQSIDIMRRFAPQAVFGPVAHDTMKGNVAHMRVPEDSLRRANEEALPAWVVFPRYVADAPALLQPRGKAASHIHLTENSFNQSVLGRRGFDVLAALIARCDCYDFSYGHLPEAMQVFADMPLPA